MKNVFKIVSVLGLVLACGIAQSQTVVTKTTTAKLNRNAVAADVPAPAPIVYTTVTASVFIDAHGQGYTGVSTAYWHFKGLPRLTAEAFVATAISGKTSVIVGTDLMWNVYSNA